MSAGTQHRRQREVKAFFSWCRRMDYVEENPFMRVPMVRREQKVVQPFAKDDITTLWQRRKRLSHLRGPRSAHESQAYWRPA